MRVSASSRPGAARPLPKLGGAGAAAENRSRRWDTYMLAASVLLVAIGVYLLIDAAGYRTAAGADPGPAAFPRVVAVLSLAAAAGLAVQAARGAAADQQHGYRWQVLATAVVIVVALLLTPVIGFLTGTALMLVGTCLVFGARWWTAIVTAVVAALAIHLLFSELLGIPFPDGPVEQLIFGV